jgi:hypothetical protein
MEVLDLNPEDGIALAEDLCDLGERIILAEGLHDWRRRAVPLVSIIP